MTVGSVPPRRSLFRLLFLLAVVGAGWCQTLLDPVPRICRTEDNTASQEDPAADAGLQGQRNEYPAGGMLLATVEMPAGLFGTLEVYLCPDGEAEDECHERVPLQLADGSGTSYDLSMVPRSDIYEIPLILPDSITCSVCTLQVRVLKRSCEDEATCPPTEETTCSNITVRDVRKHEKRLFHFLGHFISNLFGR